MTFWDDLNSWIDRAGGPLQAKVGLVLDLSAAKSRIWREAEQQAVANLIGEKPTSALYGGLDTAATIGASTVGPIGGSFRWLDVPSRELVKEPTSTYFNAWRLAGQEAMRTEDGLWNQEVARVQNMFRGDTWTDAYELAQTTSPMQAYVENLELGPWATENRRKLGGLSDEEIQKRFQYQRDHDTLYNVVTGLGDFAITWRLDPLNVAGKGLSVARTAVTRRVVKPGEDLAAITVDKPKTRLGRARSLYVRDQTIIEGTDDWNTYDYFFGMEGAKESPYGMAFASALAKTNKIDSKVERDLQKKLVLRIGRGDQSALAELQVRNAELLDQLSAVHKQRSLLMESAKYTKPGDDLTWRYDYQAMYGDRLKVLDGIEAEVQREASRIDELLTSDIFGATQRYAPRVTQKSRKGIRRAAGDTELRRTIADLDRPLVGSSLIRRSLWNVSVRVLAGPAKLADQMVTTRGHGVMDVHDPNRHLELQSLLARPQLRDMDPLVKREYVRELMDAGNDEGPMMRALAKAEKGITQHLAAKAGVDIEIATQWMNAYALQRSSWMGRLKLYAGIQDQQAYSSAPHPTKEGLKADMVLLDEEGSVLRGPVLDTDLKDRIPLLNVELFEHVLKRNGSKAKALATWLEHSITGHTGVGLGTAQAIRAVEPHMQGLAEVGHDVLNMANRAWKFAVLFRLGYPLRNITDETMRSYAMVGSAMQAIQLEGIWNKVKNMSGQSMAVKQAKFQHWRDMETANEFEEMLTQPDLDLGVRASVERMQGELAKRLDQAAKDPLKVYKVGYKDVRVKGGVVPAPFTGAEDDINLLLSSSKGLTQRMILDSEAKGLARMRASGDYRDIAPHEPGHQQAWLDSVNLHIRQSQLTKFMLEGKSNDYIVRWLKATPEGRALSKRMSERAANKEEWIASVRAHFENSVPPELLETAAKRDLKGTDLERFYSAGKAPVVNGPALQFDLGGGPAAAFINRVVGFTGKWLTEVWTDLLVRHPLYVALYRQRAAEMADILLSDPSRGKYKSTEVLDADDVERIRKASHAQALKGLKDSLYDATAHSNAAHTLRLISPFMGAWEDTLKKWWALAKEKPQILNYFRLGWEAPNRAGLITDEDGNVKMESHELHGDEFLAFRLPAWAGGQPVWTGPGGFVRTYNKNTFQIWLQSDPWFMPGMGPVVQVPIAEVARERPDLEKIVAPWILPMGPGEDASSLVTPAWVKRLQSWDDGMGKQDFARDAAAMYQDSLYEWVKGGREGPEPKWDDAINAAKGLYILRAEENAGSPFPAQFRSPYDFIRKQYFALQERARLDGMPSDWARDELVRQYGVESLILVHSLSLNNVGLQSTNESVSAWRRYKPIAQNYPEFIRNIVGNEGEGEYSQFAHQYQLQHTFAPGSTETMRSYADPAEAMREAEADTGWYEYRQITNALDAVAQANGIDSYRDDERLRLIKQMAVDDLMDRNHAWAEKWVENRGRDFEVQTFYDLERLVDSGDVDKLAAINPLRTDLAGLKEYVETRRAFAAILEQQEHKSPTAMANRDLMKLYTRTVSELVARNLQFADNWFYGDLEFDPMLVDNLVPEEVSE